MNQKSSSSLSSNNHESQDLVDRTNRLIVKHCLPVPRFVTSRFINYQFWSVVFIKLFRIKCDISLRTMNQRTEMIRSCLNKLGSLIGCSLDHIKPSRLLNYDFNTMFDLLEIAEVWSEYFNDNDDDDDNENYSNPIEISPIIGENQNYSSKFLNNSYSKSEPSIPLKISQQQQSSSINNTKSIELSNLLYSALKNLIISIEIEKKIKAYLGDVTTRKQQDDRILRASRQSIVRTRAIQPLATFDFDFTRKDKRNPILSVDLERCFPDIPNEIIKKIQNLEHNLLILEGGNNIRPWEHNKLNKRLIHMLNYVIDKQRRNFEFGIQQQQQQRKSSQKTNHLKQINRPKASPSTTFQREMRTQRAALQEEINQFYKSATASYLNARSYLERILVEEFRKVEQYQRDHINQIREYLRDHENMELDKVRTILETLEQWL